MTDPQQTTADQAHAERIDWLDWGPDVFRQARRQDKLILLDSGATWCHWCHVMDRVTYEDAEVVRLVNERFIPVRIDRDRLPQVDAHYQRAVPLVRSPAQGGWPLTVLITPDGHALYKATFLPPRASPQYGAGVGLIDLLSSLDSTWRENRQKIRKAGAEVGELLARRRTEAYSRPGKLTDAIVAAIVQGIKDAYDRRHGGFGTAPKFFAAPAVELLQVRGFAGEEAAAEMAHATLAKIACGGVYDQLGGGFHRYSVDERWHVPHFEKMAYDNAALLARYADAYAATGSEQFARVARQTRAWIDRVLRGGAEGGFFASQDADVGLDDDGDCFTWTVDEVRAALGDEADVALAWFGVDAQGDVHGRPGRNVLHVPKSLGQQAKLLDMEAAELAETIGRVKRRLLEARLKRPAPAVDTTVFADLNGMLIDAYLTVWERLGDESARKTALATLDYLLADLRDERGVFAHYRSAGGDGERGGLRRVGLLSDQAWMARALVRAYAATGEPKYIDAARKAADYILSDLAAEDGGLLDAPLPSAAQPWAPQPTRGWEDSPSRSAASVAAHVLLDLAYLTGEAAYAAATEKALAGFAGAPGRQYGTFLAGFAIAVEQFLHGPRTILVVGPEGNGTTATLARAARAAYVPNALVLAIDPSAADQAALLERLGYGAQNRPVAYVCRHKACLAPAYTPEELRRRIDELSGAPARTRPHAATSRAAGGGGGQSP